MPVRTFTPSDVDKLIPTLELLFGRAYSLLSGLIDARRDLEKAGMPTIPEQLARIELTTGHAALRGQYLAFISEVALEIKKVAVLGGIVKDLDLGLVDFPAIWHGKPVYLCWRYGEKVVGYYHDRGSGYKDRKPLGPGRVAMVDSEPN